MFSCQRCADYKVGEDDSDQLTGLLEEEIYGSFYENFLIFELEYVTGKLNWNTSWGK